MRTHSARTHSAYERAGYVTVPKTFDASALVKAANACATALSGPLPRQLGNKVMARPEFYPLPSLERTRYGLMNAHQWTDRELAPFVDIFKNILTSEKMFEALSSVHFEEHYTLHQTIFFFESPCTVPHIEAMTLDTFPQGSACTVWGAVDDVTPVNGPPYVVPTRRGFYDPYPGDTKKETHRAMVLKNICEQESQVIALALQAGSIAIWAPSTPHGSMSPHPGYERRWSFQAIYRSTRIARWGAYPNHDEPHDLAIEEAVINRRFSFLKH